MSQFLKPVLDYIESKGGTLPEHELTTRKINERATVIDYPQRPEWIAFEVERHRGLLGTAWQPGSPMDAFVTYWPCYVFDPEKQQLHTIEPRRSPKVEIDVPSAASNLLDFSFSIEEGEDGKFSFREITYNWSGVVLSVDELVQKVRHLARDLNWDCELEALQEYLKPEELQELLLEFEQAAQDLAEEKARSAWTDLG
ncbi:MAG: hypothetical protein HS116_05955 [Planctomycetes bacterium]|nr:hypothetical protein [Planctomycetota bacterium]